MCDWCCKTKLALSERRSCARSLSFPHTTTQWQRNTTPRSPLFFSLLSLSFLQLTGILEGVDSHTEILDEPHCSCTPAITPAIKFDEREDLQDSPIPSVISQGLEVHEFHECHCTKCVQNRGYQGLLALDKSGFILTKAHARKQLAHWRKASEEWRSLEGARRAERRVIMRPAQPTFETWRQGAKEKRRADAIEKARADDETYRIRTTQKRSTTQRNVYLVTGLIATYVDAWKRLAMPWRNLDRLIQELHRHAETMSMKHIKPPSKSFQASESKNKITEACKKALEAHREKVLDFAKAADKFESLVQSLPDLDDLSETIREVRHLGPKYDISTWKDFKRLVGMLHHRRLMIEEELPIDKMEVVETEAENMHRRATEFGKYLKSQEKIFRETIEKPRSRETGVFFDQLLQSLEGVTGISDRRKRTKSLQLAAVGLRFGMLKNQVISGIIHSCEAVARPKGSFRYTVFGRRPEYNHPYRRMVERIFGMLGSDKRSARHGGSGEITLWSFIPHKSISIEGFTSSLASPYASSEDEWSSISSSSVSSASPGSADEPSELSSSGSSSSGSPVALSDSDSGTVKKRVTFAADDQEETDEDSSHQQAEGSRHHRRRSQRRAGDEQSQLNDFDDDDGNGGDDEPPATYGKRRPWSSRPKERHYRTFLLPAEDASSTWQTSKVPIFGGS